MRKMLENYILEASIKDAKSGKTLESLTSGHPRLDMVMRVWARINDYNSNAIFTQSKYSENYQIDDELLDEEEQDS